MSIGMPRMLPRIASVVFVLLAVSSLIAVPGYAQPAEDEGHENLKVFPETISEDQLRGIMSSFSDALGVGCAHCHYQEPGQRPDFASDAKPEKETARAMIRMVQQINGWHLQDLPSVEAEALSVSCVTCHHGVAQPQTLDHLLANYLPEHGLDASFAKYDSLRVEYYGSAAYDFTDVSLVRLAERLIEEDNIYDAMAFLERNLEMYPNSADSYVAMAQAYLAQGDREGAILSMQRAVDLAPNSGFLQRQLDELRGGE